MLYFYFFNFSSSDQFVTINCPVDYGTGINGCVSLFKGTKMIKSVSVDPTAGKGDLTAVAYYNGKIVVGEDSGNLRIMNKDLKTTKILTGSPHIPRSILGNVDYYNTITDVDPMVSTIRLRN